MSGTPTSEPRCTGRVLVALWTSSTSFCPGARPSTRGMRCVLCANPCALPICATSDHALRLRLPGTLDALDVRYTLTSCGCERPLWRG